MAFGVGTVVTNSGKTYCADQFSAVKATYTACSCSVRWGAIGKGATGAARTAAVADTALTSELSTAQCSNGTSGSRTCGAESLITTSVTNDTYQNVGTFTAASGSSSGSQAIDEAGLFVGTSSGGGVMITSATFNVVNLNPGDSLQNTWRVQFS